MDSIISVAQALAIISLIFIAAFVFTKISMIVLGFFRPGILFNERLIYIRLVFMNSIFLIFFSSIGLINFFAGR